MVRPMAVFLIVFFGCSTEDPTPAEKCDDLAELLCERVIGCSDDGFTEAECISLPAVTNLSCPEASGVSSQYDECVDDLTVAPCSILVAEDGTVEVPESCGGAILYRR